VIFTLCYISALKTDGNINIHLCTNRSSPMHEHDFLEIAYVKQGKATHILNGIKTVIQQGDFLIIDYNSKHSYISFGTEELVIINCIFYPYFIDKTLKKCKNFSDVVNNYEFKYNYTITNNNPANYIFKDSDGIIYRLLDKMLKEYTKKRPGYHEVIRCNLIELIIYAMRKSNDENKKISDEFCSMIVKYASENLTEKNILGKLASEMNFSTSYLSRRFKEKMEVSFSEYLQRLRIEQSCRLLANTPEKITEIAYLCGYSDMKFFNNIFKKYKGITPREFRRRYR